LINKKNLNRKVIEDFGNEWSKFDQSSLKTEELKKMFDHYFHIFPLEEINKNHVGFDLGCGSGRWAKFIANNVQKLNCIDPSENSIKVAKKNLSNFKNIEYFNSGISNTYINQNSQDFGYCLGVLHHTNEIEEGINFCNKILKKNAPFLIYLYYNFENRGKLFKFIWKLSNILRSVVCQLPFKFKKIITDILALFFYLPMARLALFLNLLGLDTHKYPLSFYKDKSFYTMRTDSLDRFGTKLERRFSRKEIFEMLTSNGFKDVKFSEKVPFWVATCRKI
jgi:ubiquinone/menaquinone biosynthesis C-methylase UbiE